MSRYFLVNVLLPDLNDVNKQTLQRVINCVSVTRDVVTLAT